jgi:hypothetical protein
LAGEYWKQPYPVRGRIVDANPARPWEENASEPKQSLKQREQQERPSSIGPDDYRAVLGGDAEATEYERQRKEQWEKGVRDYRMPTFPVAPEGTEYTYLPFGYDSPLRPGDECQIEAYTQIPLKVKWLWVKPQEGVSVYQVKYGMCAAGTGAGQFETTLFRSGFLPAFGDIDVGNRAMMLLANHSSEPYIPSAVLIGLQVLQPKGRW